MADMTEAEFFSAMADIVSRNATHDYNTSGEAMVQAAVLAFNYAAQVVGATGFQAGWAAMEFLQEINVGFEAPFAIIQGRDLLYPQYDLRRKFEGYIEKWKPELASIAREMLAGDNSLTHPAVLARWQEAATWDAEVSL